MARALVVHESFFGDARAVAQAIAAGIATHLRVEVVAAADAPAEIGTDVRLLVVGGPNHRTGMPTRATRQEAMDASGTEMHVPVTGLHEWLDAVRLPEGPLAAAAFDTRLEHPWILSHLDHAARTEERLLLRDGAILVAPAEHFRVTTGAGPLVAGEEERARQWGGDPGGAGGARPGGDVGPLRLSPPSAVPTAARRGGRPRAPRSPGTPGAA